MKKIIGLVASCATALLLALPAFASLPSPQPEGVNQNQCTDESKAAWYKEFTDLRTKDAAKAYEAAKKYLGCSPAEDQYTAYLKKWVAAYDKEARKLKLPDLLYNQMKYTEAYALGKEILADDPENVKVLIDVSYAGYASKSEALSAETMAFAKKAIQLIEGGKAPENWSPYSSKEETLGYLYNTIASLSMRKSPSEGLTALIKAAQFEGKIKKLPSTYAVIAAAYETGPYAKLSADYKACCEGEEETPQSKLALENINQVVDRMIDAYARAVALAGNDPKKTEWMESLTTWYKFRHNQSDAGLNEMIASVMSKPLPPEPTPLTTLPATTPTTTPGSGAGNTGSPVSAGTGSAASGGNKPAGTSTPSTNTAAPTSTQPSKTAPETSKPGSTTKPSSTN